MMRQRMTLLANTRRTEISMSKWRDTFRNMEVGQSVECPIDKLESVRMTCSVLKFKTKMKWKTAINREKGIVTVTRVL